MSATAFLEADHAKSPNDDALFEIIDGVRVEIPPMSALSAKLANRLARRLDAYAWPTEGEAFVEVLFHLALPVDRNRRAAISTSLGGTVH